HHGAVRHRPRWVVSRPFAEAAVSGEVAPFADLRITVITAPSSTHCRPSSLALLPALAQSGLSSYGTKVPRILAQPSPMRQPEARLESYFYVGGPPGGDFHRDRFKYRKATCAACIARVNCIDAGGKGSQEASARGNRYPIKERLALLALNEQ